TAPVDFFSATMHAAPMDQAPNLPDVAPTRAEPVEPQPAPASRAWWQVDEPAPAGAPSRAQLVPFRTKGTQIPLFGIHSDSGEASWIINLMAHLSKDQPVYGLEVASMCGDEATIEQMAEACLAQILSVRPAGPYRLIGHGSGGVIAFELARRLQERGQDVSQLVLLDSHELASPELEALAEHADDSAYVLTWVVNTLRHTWGAHENFTYDALPQGDFDAQIKKVTNFFEKNVAAPISGQKLVTWLRSSALHWRRAIQALNRYWPRPLVQPVEATLIQPRRREPGHGNPYRLPALPGQTPEPGRAWRRLLGQRLRVVEVSGDRFSLISKDMLGKVNEHALGGAPASGGVRAARAPQMAKMAKMAGRGNGALPLGATADHMNGHGDDRSLGVVPINKQGIHPPSYWIHTLLGDISYALPLSQQLGRDFPLYGIEQIDPEGGLHLHSDLEEMAAEYARAIRRNQPRGPYVLGGYSFGGIVAYEVVRQIQRDGGQVSDLLLIDAMMPRTEVFNSIDTSALEQDDFSVMALIVTGNSLCNILQADRFVRLEDISGYERAMQMRRVAEHVFQHAKKKKPFEEVQRMVAENYNVIMTNNDALLGYEPRPLVAPVNTILFRAALGFVGPNNKNGVPAVPVRFKDPTNGFGAFVPNALTIFDVEADHYTICTDEAIGVVGAKAPHAFSFARRPA
ncbi:MAG TPA: thioesterase domain-containing protein, partial [Candidatus Nanopelagicales bacterium]|nr:thioesterase domain-containing protein [Candidatus Nanopelagicales bacterium]